MSVFRVAFHFRFTFACDMFPNIDRIQHITAPIFIIHGTKDEVVPFWNGEELWLVAPKKWRTRPLWIDGGGHNNLETFYR
jgi:abhydrolase domain-containing protein 17